MKKPFVLILSAITLFWAIGETAYHLRRGYRAPAPIPVLAPGMVYVTKESGQYHTSYCRFAHGGITMPQKEAERAKIIPCIKCGG